MQNKHFIWRLHHAAAQDHDCRSESRASLAELKSHRYGCRLYLQHKPHETIADIDHDEVTVRRSMKRSATLATSGLLSVSENDLEDLLGALELRTDVVEALFTNPDKTRERCDLLLHRSPVDAD